MTKVYLVSVVEEDSDDVCYVVPLEILETYEDAVKYIQSQYMHAGHELRIIKWDITYYGNITLNTYEIREFEIKKYIQK